MQMIIRGHGLEITEPLRAYAEKKIGKIGKFFANIQKVEVALDARDIRNAARHHVTQVTAWIPGGIIRCEEAAQDMYASIDLVFDKVMGQIKKYKAKHFARYRHHGRREEMRIERIALSPRPIGKTNRRIVRVKRFDLRPLTPDEAAEQMELLGHDFFLFLNSNTHEVNVLYKRQQGNFGLIEPEL